MVSAVTFSPRCPTVQRRLPCDADGWWRGRPQRAGRPPRSKPKAMSAALREAAHVALGAALDERELPPASGPRADKRLRPAGPPPRGPVGRPHAPPPGPPG